MCVRLIASKQQNYTKSRVISFYFSKDFYSEIKMDIYIKIKKVTHVTTGM